MFLWRNKKNINNLWLKKLHYLKICMLQTYFKLWSLFFKTLQRRPCSITLSLIKSGEGIGRSVALFKVIICCLRSIKVASLEISTTPRQSGHTGLKITSLLDVTGCEFSVCSFLSFNCRTYIKINMTCISL